MTFECQGPGDPPGAIVRAPPLKPASGGGPFAVLLSVPVLRLNKFRRQGQHILRAGRDQHGGDRQVAVQRLAILQFGV